MIESKIVARRSIVSIAMNALLALFFETKESKVHSDAGSVC